MSRKLEFEFCFGGGRTGVLGLLWNSDLQVYVTSFSGNHIDAKMGECEKGIEDD